MLLQIDLPYACAGIVVENDMITEAAPIFKWMVGKDLNYVCGWVQSKGGVVKGMFEIDAKNWHGVWGTIG